jgi:EpsI family protein
MRNLALAIPALLVAQALIVGWATHGERPPNPPDLARFPANVGPWKYLRDDPIAPEVEPQLHADRLLNRTYIRQPNLRDASLFVAWFRSVNAGGQPHSPQVCLPGNGWLPQATDLMTVPTAIGPIRVNRYIVTNQGARAVVLYWYQSPRRVVAGEWEAKFWVIPDALRDRRTDTSLVRIVVWANGGDSEATSAAAEFARYLYPVLRQQLPR